MTGKPKGNAYLLGKPKTITYNRTLNDSTGDSSCPWEELSTPAKGSLPNSDPESYEYRIRNAPLRDPYLPPPEYENPYLYENMYYAQTTYEQAIDLEEVAVVISSMIPSRVVPNKPLPGVN
jgi:hypothetical protein